MALYIDSAFLYDITNVLKRYLAERSRLEYTCQQQ